jgi:hypothetical protein
MLGPSKFRDLDRPAGICGRRVASIHVGHHLAHIGASATARSVGRIRFRLRGLANVNIQALMVATGQNLKRWLQATGWGHRNIPGAAFAPVGAAAHAAKAQ